MGRPSALDCIVVGYNEMPFHNYVKLLSKKSIAYRDLKLSFVDLNGKPTSYVTLLNHAFKQAGSSCAWDDPERGPLKSGDIPSLAAVYLSNFMRNRQLTTKYINLFQDEKERFAQLLQQNPICVAITTTFYVLNFPVSEIISFVREHNPQTKIVVGGPLVGNLLRGLREEDLTPALLELGADFYVVDSQGELTLANLVTALKAGEDDPATVPNLAYFRNGALVRTPVFPEMNSLDEVDINWLAFAREEDLGQTIQLRTARSCAFKCSFCNYPTRAGKLSLASLETVERELSSIKAIGDVKNVVFIDDTFNVPLPRFKEMCRMMVEKKFNFNWFSYFRCSNSDEEAIQLMAESGCKGVFLGIESGSPAILKNMNKAATIERYAEGIRLLRSHGITTFGSFIVGFPGETRETVEETEAFIRDHKPDFWRAQIWYCEAGTPIDRERDKYGVTGHGFVWRHATMSSTEAMDHIERMYLSIKESVWLPQWSFDFWFIPYALGKGIPIDQFKQFVFHADQLLALDIAYCPEDERKRLKNSHFDAMVALAKGWNIQTSSRPLASALAV